MLDGGWRFGPYELYAGTDRVMRGRKRLAFTETEVKLLSVLARNGGEAVSREEIFGAVWSVQMTDDHTLTMHMSRLRQELGEEIIPPSQGGGYRLGGAVEPILTVPELQVLWLSAVFIEADEKRQRMPDTEWDAAYLHHADAIRAALDWALDVPGRRHLAIRLAGASGRIWQRLGALTEGRAYLDRAVALIDDDVRPADAAGALYYAGVLIREADRPRSLALLERAAALYQRLQKRERLGAVLGLIGGTQLFLGRYDAARASLLQAEKILVLGDQSKALLNIFNGLGILAAMQKAPQEAIRYFGQARDIARLLNDPLRGNYILLNIGELEFEQGAVDRAIERASEAAAGLASEPASYRVRAIVNLAIYHAIAGNLGKAKKSAKEALDLAAADGGHWLRLCLQVWAYIAAYSGRAADAARLLGFVDALFAKVGEVRDPSDQQIYDRLMRKLRASLSPESFDVWRREGGTWSEAQAVQWVKDRIAAPEKTGGGKKS
jgi:DNA-binding winged helix-turn-helix (wHTH) protein/tetratricopeptide (TPR) repeat protein